MRFGLLIAEIVIRESPSNMSCLALRDKAKLVANKAAFASPMLTSIILSFKVLTATRWHAALLMTAEATEIFCLAGTSKFALEKPKGGAFQRTFPEPELPQALL
jgi:hypothetical protein